MKQNLYEEFSENIENVKMEDRQERELLRRKCVVHYWFKEGAVIHILLPFDLQGSQGLQCLRFHATLCRYSGCISWFSLSQLTENHH